MESPQSRQACSYMAHQLFELYLLPADTGRIELIDALLEESGVLDPKDRDKILLFCDRAHLKLEAHKKDLARLLLRCAVLSLDEAEEQLRLKFG